MKHEWMIAVLADLRKFAKNQAMLELAEHLDDAIVLAVVEIRNNDGGRVVSVEVNDDKAGSVSGAIRRN